MDLGILYLDPAVDDTILISYSEGILGKLVELYSYPSILMGFFYRSALVVTDPVPVYPPVASPTPCNYNRIESR